MRPLVVGLGNVGDEYTGTRHNMGFDVVDMLAESLGAAWKEECERRAWVATTPSVVLAKPTTYMNLSGEAAAALVAFYKPSKVIAVYDDADLPLGDIRVREEGGSAGHNGVESLMKHLGASGFVRVRVGIGRPAQKEIPLEDWVLGKWGKEELAEKENARKKASESIGDMVDLFKIR